MIILQNGLAWVSYPKIPTLEICCVLSVRSYDMKPATGHFIAPITDAKPQPTTVEGMLRMSQDEGQCQLIISFRSINCQ